MPLRLFCLLMLFAFPAHAQKADLARESFEKMILAADNNDAAAAKAYVMRSAHPLFDRFTSYGLLPCLPKDSQYESEEAAGSFKLLRAGMTGLNGKWQLARLYFTKEDAIWKWDVNETLRRGMGENWQNQLNTTEQILLLLRQQMGGKLDCGTIRDLVKPMDKSAK